MVFAVLSKERKVYRRQEDRMSGFFAEASLPFGPRLWDVRPEEKYIQTLISEFKKKTGWRRWTQYNMYTVRLLPRLRINCKKYILRWHQGKCMFAAIRAWGVLQSKILKQALPPDLQNVTNPLSGKAFGDLNKTVCNIRHPSTKKTEIYGTTLRIPLRTRL